MHTMIDGGAEATVRRRWLRSGGALVAIVALLAAAACGDDDSDTTAAEDADDSADADEAAGSDTDLDAYCEAVLALEMAPPPDIDFATATPEEIAAGLQAHAADTMRPLADEVLAVAPDELADDLDAMDGALTELEATGDIAVFDQPEAAEASDRLHSFDLDNCGWTTTDITATNYAFDGIPDELPTGVTSFEMTNDGTDVHEFVLFRKNDGVTQSAEDLLALPPEEALQQVTQVGFQDLVSPGDASYSVVDLAAGDYVAVCFLPVGMTSEQEPPPADAPPHFTHGMFAEFTVSA
ncbi:MAG: hypothetical protein ACRD2C_18900 [Acidimicrobiales bacterium]